ncbi:MAG TPA: site-specific DNA-methyltransferase [Massilibacterium sp.]|nr:site-specific DNA-methyltransferase [Massilibacterium sp.]
MMKKEHGDTYVSKYDKSIHLDINKIYQGDCLELMNGIPDKSVDMILCDLPYGTTACKWDTIIPFDRLWCQYERVIKDNGAIVLFGSEPFSSKLRMSNIKNYKYDWIWDKNKGSNYASAKYMPLKIHETISVFSKGNKRVDYYPVMREGKMRNKKSYSKGGGVYGSLKSDGKDIYNNLYYPVSILNYSNARQKGKVHPTQKPVPLIEYLIKTYTNEGETVLDNCIGSGTTAIAALNTGRYFIGIEKEKEYVDIANKRVEEIKQPV